MNLSKNKFFTQNIVSASRAAEHYLVECAGNYSKFKIEPLSRGVGLTIGNSLRRVMLSSLWGTAVIGFWIEGIEHQYSTIKGIKEDIIEIMLNLKSIVLRSDTAEKQIITLNIKGPTVVTAGMLSLPRDMVVINKDAVVCTINDPKVEIKMEIYTSGGNGYITAEANQVHLPPKSSSDNIIAIDSVFSPIKQISFEVESFFGPNGPTDEVERLFLAIETNGAVEPETAMFIAAKILQNQLQPLVSCTIEAPQMIDQESSLKFDHRLLMKVENLELSVRSQNCLKNENIVYIGDLISKAEGDILRTPNFGKKSLEEIKKVLSVMNLFFGMDVQGWPPEGNIEELAKKYEENI